MADKTYKISFEVDGLTGEVKNVQEFTKEMDKAKDATKGAAEEGSALALLKSKFAGVIGPLKGIVAGMKTLKGAIISTGIGALIVALGALVSYFTTSEKGSKQLAIAMETLGLLFGKLTEFAANLGEKIVGAFQNPMEAIKNLGRAIVDNVIERFRSALEVVGLLGTAIYNVFQGNFEEAFANVKEAGSELVDVFTGVDNSVEKIGETATKVFNEVKTAIAEATATAEKLVNAQRALRDQQQRLIVENALLNKELEEQKKIAEDTSLAYEERAAALEKVGETQIKLAKNVAAQAKAEEDLIKLQIANESNYEKREELETQLAEATAARIDAQTALSIVELEAAKLGRELELEELDRKRSIRDLIEELNKEELDNAFEMARQELDIAERQAMEELELLKATDEEKLLAAEGFAKQRSKIAEEEAKFREQLEKQVQEANLSVASEALGAVSGLLGENSKAAKAFAVAQTTIDTYLGAQKAYTSQLIPGDPTSPVRAAIAAGVAVASGLANVRAILKTNPNGGGGAPSAPNIPSFNPDATINIPQAGNNVVTPQGQTVVKAYVVSSDMTSQQEADKKINDLAKL